MINNDEIHIIMYKLSLCLFVSDNFIVCFCFKNLICNLRNNFMITVDEHIFENNTNASSIVMNDDPFALGELKISFDNTIEYTIFIKYNNNIPNMDVSTLYKKTNVIINDEKILT